MPGDTSDTSTGVRKSVPVYLITVNLERSENSYNYSAPFWRRYLPRNIRLFKHWAILVGDTVYELARDDASGVKLSTSSWTEVKNRFDAPERIGLTSLRDSEIQAIGMIYEGG